MSVQIVRRGEGLPPLYRQISDLLRQEIRDQHQLGDMLPSENTLAERFQVNRHTLRRAIEDLIAEGIVVRHHGVGIQVVEPTLDYAITANTRFTQTLESLGLNSISRVLRKQIIHAQEDVAMRLQVERGTKVLHLETLRKVNGKPFCVISHYLGNPVIDKVYQTYNKGSLHCFFNEHCDVNLRRQESHISAILPSDSDVKLLNMPRFLPVLRVKSVNADVSNGLPVEYCVTRFRGDAVQLSVKPSL
ncbi:transcriptional regulator, GntR family [Alteromonadaceae bacterium 2753L.S.0a.02]|nr:transcriptional regulator, GntR family [Alteromonadaceae bacterium 2753L.S.0a.02]